MLLKVSKSKLINYILIFTIALASFVRGFTSYVFGSASFFIIIMTAISFVAIFISLKKRVVLEKIDLMWFIVFAFYVFRHSSGYPTQYVAVFIAAFLVSYMLRTKIESVDFMLKLIVIFSILSVLATWLELLLPDIYFSLILPIFPEATQSSILIQFNQGRMVGLAYHYSPNAFYVLNGSLVLIADLYVKRKDKYKIIKYILVCIQLMTLFAIGKRGHLLFFVFALFVTNLIIQPGLVRKLKRSAKFIAGVIILFALILRFVPQAQYIIERIVLQNSKNDITTGRLGLYQLALRLFSKSPVFGIGIGEFRVATGMKNSGVHNDYLQILCETGIIGFIVFMIANIGVFIMTYRTFKQIWSENNNMIFKKIVIYSFMFQVFFLTYSFTGLPRFDYEINTIYLIVCSIPIGIDSYYRSNKKYEKNWHNNLI